MKITDLNGMIKLEADDRKVLTTIEPSSLRVKLLYVNKDNINNFIEVNEHPEIILPEEPSLDESLEELNGLTLVEAYHRLLNENRLLKEENKEQDQLIDISMLVMDEMYMMLEPLLADMYTGGKNATPLINMYTEMISRGLKKIDEIPEKYRERIGSRS